MTNPTEPTELAELLLHDLRRFLHHAHDQQVVLVKISKAIEVSSSRLKDQEATIKKILQNLNKQINQGVDVRLDADLRKRQADPVG